MIGTWDIYTFTAKPNQSIFVAPYGEAPIQWTMFDETGKVLFDLGFKIADPGIFTLTQGGIHTIVVEGFFSTSAGTYSFQIREHSP